MSATPSRLAITASLALLALAPTAHAAGDWPTPAPFPPAGTDEDGRWLIGSALEQDVARERPTLVEHRGCRRSSPRRFYCRFHLEGSDAYPRWSDERVYVVQWNRALGAVMSVRHRWRVTYR